MPVDPFGCDGDFRDEIGAGEWHSDLRRAAQRDAANDPVFRCYVVLIEKSAERGALLVVRHGRGDAHAKSLRARRLYAPPGA